MFNDKVCDVGQSFVEAGVCDIEVELGTEVEVCDADTTEGEGCSEGEAPHPSLPSLLAWDLLPPLPEESPWDRVALLVLLDEPA